MLQSDARNPTARRITCQAVGLRERILPTRQETIKKHILVITQLLASLLALSSYKLSIALTGQNGINLYRRCPVPSGETPSLNSSCNDR